MSHVSALALADRSLVIRGFNMHTWSHPPTCLCTIEAVNKLAHKHGAVAGCLQPCGHPLIVQLGASKAAKGAYGPHGAGDNQRKMIFDSTLTRTRTSKNSCGDRMACCFLACRHMHCNFVSNAMFVICYRQNGVGAMLPAAEPRYACLLAPSSLCWFDTG